MARQRMIVGIGEALMCEYPDLTEPGGLAIRVAQSAARLGHIGIPISRLGQDQFANELLTELRAQKISIEHIQSDPDLPTGRLVVRSIAGKQQKTLTPRAAFDNLQWDFDLVDVAQQADGIIFGMLGQRDGQSRSIIARFLSEARNAIRLFDLSNRESDAIDRAQVRASLEYAHGVIIDRTALKAITPGWDGEHIQQPATQLLREHQLAFVIAIDVTDCRETISVISAEGMTTSPGAFASSQHIAATVSVLHGLIHGWEMPKTLERAVAIAEHTSKSQDAVPRELLEG